MQIVSPSADPKYSAIHNAQADAP